MNDFRCLEEQHNKKKIVSVLLAEQAYQKNRFLCFQCQGSLLLGGGQLKQNYNGPAPEAQLCDIDELIEGDHNSIYNWPIDPTGKQIKELLATYQTPDQAKQDVENYFNQLKQKIITEIDSAKALVMDLVIGSTVEIKKDLTVKEQKKEAQPQQQQQGKDQPKDQAKEQPKDQGKDQTKDQPKDQAKDKTKEDKPKDEQTKDKKKDTKEATKEAVKEQPKVPEPVVTIQALKLLYDQAFDVAKLKQIIKDNYKQDTAVLNQKVNDFLADAKRKDLIKQAKDMATKLGASGQAKKYVMSKSQKQSYEDELMKNVKNWTIQFGQQGWRFEVSKAEESAKINQVVAGVTYAGAASQSQIIYSNSSFNSGEHGFVVLFDEIDPNRAGKQGNLYVGLVSDTDRDKKGYGYGLRKDLYSSLGSGIVSKVGTDFTTVLKPKVSLFVHIDVSNNILEIFDSKRTVVYTIDKEEKLVGTKWRFYIYWKDAGDQIRLVHSY